MKKELEFPAGFLWGSGVSSYQVEGGIEKCNWSKDFPAGRACDYYNNYEKYFDIAEELNQNVHRFSLEWSRIEPEEGKFDREAIDHYKKVLMSLKRRDIKTMVTLWHVTIPEWLAEKGGWANSKMPQYFQRYASYVAGELDCYVDFWITLNEPGITISNGYLLGKFPPLRKNDLAGSIRAFFNFVSAHKKAYSTIRNLSPQAKVGMAENYSFAESYEKKSAINNLAVRIWDFLRNRALLELTRNEQDFLGVNYYFHERIKTKTGWPFVEICNENRLVSDRGCEIYPKGIYEVLKSMKKQGLPVYITENGVDDKGDKYRTDFIKKHLEWVHKAIEEGVDVRGYLYWSLLDNFEWELGFEPRYGLVEMDYNTLDYKIRPSAFEYAKICKDNKLTIEE